MLGRAKTRPLEFLTDEQPDSIENNRQFKDAVRRQRIVALSTDILPNGFLPTQSFPCFNLHISHLDHYLLLPRSRSPGHWPS